MRKPGKLWLEKVWACKIFGSKSLVIVATSLVMVASSLMEMLAHLKTFAIFLRNVKHM